MNCNVVCRLHAIIISGQKETSCHKTKSVISKSESKYPHHYGLSMCFTLLLDIPKYELYFQDARGAKEGQRGRRAGCQVGEGKEGDAGECKFVKGHFHSTLSRSREESNERRKALVMVDT